MDVCNISLSLSQAGDRPRDMLAPFFVVVVGHTIVADPESGARLFFPTLYSTPLLP